MNKETFVGPDDLAAYFGGEDDAGQAYCRAPGHSWRPGWSWSAFALWFLWFWYRKLWLAGLAALAAPLALQAVAGDWGGLAGYVGMAVWAKAALAAGARSAIGAADHMGLEGDERRAFLGKRGGRSRAGLALGILVFLALTAIGTWQAMNQLPELLDQLDAAGLLPRS